MMRFSVEIKFKFNLTFITYEYTIRTCFYGVSVLEPWFRCQSK